MRTTPSELFRGGHVDEPAGDDERLFADVYPSLRRFAAVVAPLDLDPDDLVQEAVARALQLGPLARLDHPAAYLKQSMVNLAANHNRSRGRERRATRRLEAVRSTDAPAAYPSDLSDLERLDPADRAALYLADVDRLPLAEVARILDISAAAARARVSRARRRLRRHLSEGDAP